MKTIHYEIKNTLGIRLHSLAELSSIASKYDSSVFGSTGMFKADIKSLLSVVALEFQPGNIFTIMVEGPDENDVVVAINEFFENINSI